MKGGHMNDAIVTQLLDTKLLPIGKQEKPKYFNDINFAIKKMCLYQPDISRFWKIYFKSLQAN